MTVAVLDGGTFYHHETIFGDRFRDRFDRVIYAPALTASDLTDVTLLIVPDRLNPDLLRRHRPLLTDVLARGRTLVVLGECEAETWAPGVRSAPRPTNFWWWLDPAETPPHRFVAPEHEMFRHVAPESTVWHIHGVLFPPDGAVPLVTVPEDRDGRDPGGALLYDDRVTTPGRLIVSTLDPFYHHGSRFMPATTRFLDGFLTWTRALARS
ncbi:hypothetical protein PQJ75_25330 [Rhodoplanes sp. TEM]|uniref:Glutamine amidotransferase domain-containing protein n=1 Tax=Rhodoplanes tepidamans TaxID=200616 RepID=A0ABT5JIW7_RHOTP|nr:MULTISPECIES: hypothetical protein [Rhodoplanes]MDC7789658.1 hypothetical protein [Rhodoplanes tepidamans]MDC7987067.1 hypothetical protein [Rhodoplanes sp. TEM]MDQ0353594.1 hypothetical protein [Rhodoplanes tepidamans]